MDAIIPDLEENHKLRSLARRILAHREFFPAIVVVVVGIISFGLGRLSMRSSSGVSSPVSASLMREERPGAFQSAADDGAQQPPLEASTQTASDVTAASVASAVSADATAATQSEKKYVASKNSDKYHLPWCSGAARIAEENKIWFSSKEEAAAAGYTPAANCKGI